MQHWTGCFNKLISLSWIGAQREHIPNNNHKYHVFYNTCFFCRGSWAIGCTTTTTSCSFLRFTEDKARIVRCFSLHCCELTVPLCVATSQQRASSLDADGATTQSDRWRRSAGKRWRSKKYIYFGSNTPAMKVGCHPEEKNKHFNRLPSLVFTFYELIFLQKILIKLCFTAANISIKSFWFYLFLSILIQVCQKPFVFIFLLCILFRFLYILLFDLI